MLNSNCVFVLVGEVVGAARRSRSKTAPGLYPLGTAFAVKTTSLCHLLSAYHVIAGNPDCSKWYITPQVNRLANGEWDFRDRAQLIEVSESAHDDHDVVILVVGTPFAPEHVVDICPPSEITTIADECLFKTYYCPLDDICEEPEPPPLAPSPSDSQKMFAIKNSKNGMMWLRGGLCGGSSGGVVVNQGGRAVGMHIESNSSSLTVVGVVEADKKQGKRFRGEDDMSVHSDSISSIANSHGSSQVVVLLSQNALVCDYLQK